MRASPTPPRCIVAPRRRSIGGLARRHARHAVVICAAALAGCAQAYSDYTESISDGRPSVQRRSAVKKSVPLPGQALLAPQDKPDCEGTGRHLPSSGASAAVAPTPAPPTPPPEMNADLALRIKLEYERECYRQAEARVREQLRKLQASASDTVKAVKQLEHDQRY